MSKSKIRYNARQHLSCKWVPALIISCLLSSISIFMSLGTTLISHVLTMTSIFPPTFDIYSFTAKDIFDLILPFIAAIPFLCLFLLIYCPIKMGETSFYWLNTIGQKSNAQCALQWFNKKDYKRIISASFFTIVYKLFWMILCFIPGIILGCISEYFLQNPSTHDSPITFIFLFISIFSFIAGFYSWLRIIQRYFLVPYLLTDHKELSYEDAINTSKKIMKGKCGSCLHFQFTFLGWFILCIFTILPFLYLIPYFYQAQAEYACMILNIKTAPLPTLTLPRFCSTPVNSNNVNTSYNPYYPIQNMYPTQINYPYDNNNTPYPNTSQINQNSQNSYISQNQNSNDNFNINQ